MGNKKRYIMNVDIILVSFIFLLLFLLPMIFTRNEGKLAWNNVIKIWQDRVLLIPLFAINHWFLVPRLVLRKKYSLYLTTAIILIAFLTACYYFIDEPLERKKHKDYKSENASTFISIKGENPEPRPPKPVPPYADLLLFSLLIVSVDTGLSLSKYWHINEEHKVQLEKENIQAQLGMLRNQISPHFFMNTLNNIYSLIEADKLRARQSVMKLSKLMRYLLYENQNGKVLLSREFDFIRSYIDLMKLRFIDDVEINLIIPESYKDIEIPVLLFISYLENAFKFGTSYELKSSIHVVFTIKDNYLIFSCTNNKNVLSDKDYMGGIGLQNSRHRLDLLFKQEYNLTVYETDETYTVNLKIPLK